MTTRTYTANDGTGSVSIEMRLLEGGIVMTVYTERPSGQRSSRVYSSFSTEYTKDQVIDKYNAAIAKYSG